MDVRVYIIFAVIVCFFIVICYMTIGIFPQVYEVNEERKYFINNQFDLFDAWGSVPVDQQQRFYFYNITNVDELHRFDSKMLVEEVGPFVYNTVEKPDDISKTSESLNYLSLQDMTFSPKNSIADDSSSLYVLNIPVIKSLYDHGLGILIKNSFKSLRKKDIIYKTTVKDVLREIVDGYSVKHSLPIPRSKLPVTCKKTNRLKSDYEYDDYYYAINNLDNYFENKLCVKLLNIFRLVDAPFYGKGSLSSTFKKSPCGCFKFSENGTELISKTYPDKFKVMTRRYILEWNDQSCSALSNNAFYPTLDDAPFQEGILSTSPHTYFDNKSYIHYKTKLNMEEVLDEPHINMEPMTDIITDIFFRYQFNIHLKSANDGFKCRNISHEIYPILLIEITGDSKDEINYRIYRNIVFPRVFMHYVLPKIIFVVTCMLLTAGVITFALYMSTCRNAVSEGTPLLNHRARIYA